MLALMLDQLNLKLTAFSLRTWTIDAYQREMIETKLIVGCKMVSVKVDLCMQRKCHFIEINLQPVVDGKLRVITAPVKELHERAIAAAIHENIVSCLAKLGILEKQIQPDSDKGFNVLKVGKLMRSDSAMPKNFADQSDEDEYDVTEASDCELRGDIVELFPSNVLFTHYN